MAERVRRMWRSVTVDPGMRLLSFKSGYIRKNQEINLVHGFGSILLTDFLFFFFFWLYITILSPSLSCCSNINKLFWFLLRIGLKTTYAIAPSSLRSECYWVSRFFLVFNHLNAELNPICHLLALLWVHHFLHVSRTRVKVFDSYITILGNVSCLTSTAASHSRRTNSSTPPPRLWKYQNLHNMYL